MSASLPDPPEHSRILQSSPPAMPTQPWIKIIIGFTLGVVCTFLLSTYLLAPSKPLQPDSRMAKWAESKNAEAAKSAPATGGTANAQESSGRTDASSPDDSASRDAAAATNAGDPCDRQTWPYVSHECAAAQRTRNVRVIPTDKSAPTTIVTAAPTVTPPPPATNGQGPHQEPPAAGVSMPSSGAAARTDPDARSASAGCGRPRAGRDGSGACRAAGATQAGPAGQAPRPCCRPSGIGQSGSGRAAIGPGGAAEPQVAGAARGARTPRAPRRGGPPPDPGDHRLQ